MFQTFNKFSNLIKNVNEINLIKLRIEALFKSKRINNDH